MASVFKICSSDKYGWCQNTTFPKEPVVYSPLLKRSVALTGPGPGRGEFERLPRKRSDIIGSTSGAIYSCRFKNIVENADMSGLQFFPIELNQSSKMPDCQWFRAMATHRVKVCPSSYCGDDFDICPVTGLISIKESIPYHPPPEEIVLFEKPETDFFSLENIASNTIYLKYSCLLELKKLGVSDFLVIEYAQNHFQ